MDPVCAAKLRVMSNDLKSKIRNVVRYNTEPVPPHKFTSCRILKIDDKLKAAVFSAGYRNGLRAGMVLRTLDGKTMFQIVMLKDFTSAGLFLTGSPDEVSIGTELTALSSQAVK